MATSMLLANAAVDPLTGNAACGAIVELILLVELIPEILVLSALTAAVVEDSVVCVEGMLCCC